MNKLRVFYELGGTQQYEEFEPIAVFHDSKVYIDYHGMVQRALQYAEYALPDNARKVNVVWDV